MTTPEAGTVRVQGTVRRVAILTVRDEPCACYLARRLRETGVEILFLSQRRLSVELNSRAYFLRLLRRRGLPNAVDNLLLHVARQSARGLTRLLPTLRGMLRGHGSVAADSDPSLPTLLRADPDLRHEPWLTYREIEDVNRTPDRDLLTDFGPDLLLLGGAPVLGRRVIRSASVACLNSHCGISPRYAGSSPFDHAILERRFSDIGYTVHVVVPRVDGGPIVVQERIPWDPHKPNGALWPILAQRMYDALADVSLKLISGEAVDARPQSGVRVNPPAGLVVRARAEFARRALSRRTAPGTTVGGEVDDN